MSKNWPEVQKLFPEGPTGGRALNLSVDMPVEEARKLAGKAITVYAVGTMITANAPEEDSKYFHPTISDPTRTRINSYILPLLAQQLIVVVEGHARPIAVVCLSGKALMVP